MNTILIVDDHDSNRNMLRQLLRNNGYQTLEATNGQQAVEVFQQKNPDLILMDIMMPVMNGHQSAKQIKTLCGDEYVPIIFITALSSDESLTETLNAGGDDFVGKPFNFDVIQSKISVHLRIRKLTQQLADQNAYLKHEDQLINYFFDNALKQSFLDKRYINYQTSPLSAFNGDIILSERGPNGGLYLVIGDFTGHGLAASLGTLPVSQIFFRMTRNGSSINEIVREINIQLKNILPVGMFFAANILQLAPSGSYISIWSGGLMDGFHFDSMGNEKPTISSNNPPLGVLPMDMFNSEPLLLPVEKGDKLYFYSDGVIESRNLKDEMFGDKRLHKVLLNNKNNRIQELVKALEDFCGECEQTDDITVVELTCEEIPAEKKDTNINNNKILPFQCSIEFNATMLQELDPVIVLLDILSSQPALAIHRSMLHSILNELMTSSIEQSLLGLDETIKPDNDHASNNEEQNQSALKKFDSVNIKVEFKIDDQYTKPYLKIIMEDNGQGIKEPNLSFSGHVFPEQNIKVTNELVDSITYSKENRRVEVIYNLGD